MKGGPKVKLKKVCHILILLRTPDAGPETLDVFNLNGRGGGCVAGEENYTADAGFLSSLTNNNSNIPAM